MLKSSSQTYDSNINVLLGPCFLGTFQKYSVQLFSEVTIQRCSYEKVFWEYAVAKFTGEHPCRSVISIATLLKSRFGMGVALYICSIFTEQLFLRTPLAAASVLFRIPVTNATSNKNQKQPSRGVLRKRCFENMQRKFTGEHPMPKWDFNKVAKQLHWNCTSV